MLVTGDRSRDLAPLHAEMRACRLCLDAGHNIVAGAVFRGQAEAQVILIGQAPGNTEVTAKRPFNAGSGRRLFQWLNAAGWDEDDFRDNQYMTAVTKCYPGTNKSGKGDRVPSRAEQALCRPYLDQEIRLVDPLLLILVGGLAIKLVYPTSARLDEIIGTAAYFPPEVMGDPLNLDLSQAQIVRSAEAVALLHPAELPREKQSTVETGRFVVPLPHPSGASLWTNKPENKVLIQQATELLGNLRTTYLL